MHASAKESKYWSEKCCAVNKGDDSDDKDNNDSDDNDNNEKKCCNKLC